MNSAGFRRLYSMSAKTSSAPFSRAVVNAIRRLLVYSAIPTPMGVHCWAL